MTNINLNENVNKTFQPFIQRDNQGYSSYTQNQINTTQNQDSYENQSNPPNKKKHHKLIIIGETVGVVGVLGVITIAFSKSANISKTLKTFALKLQNKYGDIKNHNFLHKVMTFGASILDKGSKIMTNSSPIKDYTLHQGLEKFKPLRKARDWVSKWFYEENKNSVIKSMKTSRESYNEFIATVETSLIRSRTRDPKTGVREINSKVKDEKAFKELEELMGKARQNPEFLLPHTLESIYDGMQDDMKYLSQEMSLQRLFSREALQGFIPEDILAKRRIGYVKKIVEQKNEISCSHNDIADFVKDRLTNTNILIYSIKDPKTHKILRDNSKQLQSNIESYVQNFSDKAKRPEIINNLKQTVLKMQNEVNQLPNGRIKEQLSYHLEEYSGLFKDSNHGRVQKIRKLAGEAWGDGSEFDTTIRNTAQKHSKDLNSTQDSMINMFDKERDLTLGSGPGDVLGLILPFVGLGYKLHKDETNEERIGTGLKLGIPLIGGTAAFFVSLKKQVNGSKALLMSVGISALLNVAGDSFYKLYLKARKNEIAEAEEQSKTTAQQP